MDEVLADNMNLIDQAYGAGSSINVNGTLVTSPNLSSTLPVAPAGKTLVTFQFDSNGNISAWYTPGGGGGTVTSVFGRTGAVTAQSGDYSYAQISGTPQLPITKNAVASNWLNSYDSTTGLFTVSQPAASDLSNGATGTGAVVLASAISGFGSGTVTSFSAGTLSPLFTTSVATATTTPALSFSLTSQTANTFLAGPTSGGAAGPTFRAIGAGDIPSGTVLWNQIGNATGALSLSNAGNASTFSQTSAVTWAWNNTTVALAAGTVAPSPLLGLGGRVFSTGVDTATAWTIQSTQNPTTALSFSITIASESAGNVITLTIGAHTLVVGNMITVSGISTPNFTYMNTLNGRITSITANTILFTDSSGHGAQGGTTSNGTVTQIPESQLQLLGTGGAGDYSTVFQNSAGFGSSDRSGGPIKISGLNAFAGFGAVSATGGLAVYMGSTGGLASTVLATFYAHGFNAAANATPTTIGSIEYGDSSVGNSTFGFLASFTNASFRIEGNMSTGTSNPGVGISGHASGGGFTAASGNQIGVGLGYGKGTTTGINFKPTSGTATFQSLVNKYTVNQTGGANGTVTGIMVNAVETAVVGTHNLIDLQAGSAGTTSEFIINNVGLVKKYNAIATVSNGVPSELATVDLTAQTAAIAATTAYAVTVTGMYRVSWSATITTAGTTSVLGGTNGFQVVYTSPTDSVVKTTVPGNSVTSAANTTGTAVGGCEVVYAKTGTNIQYQYDYTSTGTSMVYELHIKVEAL